MLTTFIVTLKRDIDRHNTACDGQTDGQTSCHGIVRAMHTRRAVKIRELFLKFAKRQLTNCGDVHNKLSDI